MERLQRTTIVRLECFLFFVLNGPGSYNFIKLYTQALQENEELASRPASGSKPGLGKDVSGTVDFDAMEEYCIIVLPGGEELSAVLSEKGMETEQLNTVEKEIQTERLNIVEKEIQTAERLNIVEKEIQTNQSKLVNVAMQKSLSKLYRSEGM